MPHSLGETERGVVTHLTPYEALQPGIGAIKTCILRTLPQLLAAESRSNSVGVTRLLASKNRTFSRLRVLQDDPRRRNYIISLPSNVVTITRFFPYFFPTERIDVN